MAAEFVLASEAEQDLAEAYDWYEVRRLGLGEDFLGCVDASIQGICRAPELHARVFEDYRRVLVRRFPYAILYGFDRGIVTIYGVFHTSRDPDKWRERLQ